jgi:hypothetical protein
VWWRFHVDVTLIIVIVWWIFRAKSSWKYRQLNRSYHIRTAVAVTSLTSPNHAIKGLRYSKSNTMMLKRIVIISTKLTITIIKVLPRKTRERWRICKKLFTFSALNDLSNNPLNTVLELWLALYKQPFGVLRLLCYFPTSQFISCYRLKLVSKMSASKLRALRYLF